MKSFQPIFLLFSILAAASMMAIGIFIAEGSALGIISSIIALFIIMGSGFVTKKRMREKGLL